MKTITLLNTKKLSKCNFASHRPYGLWGRGTGGSTEATNKIGHADSSTMHKEKSNKQQLYFCILCWMVVQPNKSDIQAELFIQKKKDIQASECPNVIKSDLF
jgi:hypothetical protein